MRDLRADTPEAHSVQHYLNTLLHVVTHARDMLRVWTAPYETTPPFAFGGPTGTYRLRNPFNTPAEFCLSSVGFGGASACTLSATMTYPAPTATSTYDPTASRDQLVFFASAAGSYPQPELWYPVDANADLILNVAGANASIANVQFRRRINPAGVYSESR